MIYDVEMEWPRSSRQPAYAIQVEAQSQTEAKFIARMAARQEGWKGEPVNITCRHASSEQVA